MLRHTVQQRKLPSQNKTSPFAYTCQECYQKHIHSGYAQLMSFSWFDFCAQKDKVSDVLIQFGEKWLCNIHTSVDEKDIVQICIR